MDAHNQAIEDAAEAWLEEQSTQATEPALRAIRAITPHLVTPAMIAALAACLSSLAGALPPDAKELAQESLDTCFDDMQEFT